MICRVCDRDITQDRDRCTNQCCHSCHVAYCSPGGSTFPGHGLNVALAREVQRGVDIEVHGQ